MITIVERVARAAHWQWTPGAKRWSAGALVALVYALIYAVDVVGSGLSTQRMVTSLLLLTLMSAVYVIVPGGLFTAPVTARWVLIALIVLLVAAQIPLIGTDAVGLLIFPGVAAGLLLPIRSAVGFALCVGVAMVAIGRHAPGGPPWELALTEVALTLWMAGFAKNIGLNAALRRAHEQLARTAVLAERDRIARDLHDILGHSLTAITVKAALARQLLGRDPDKVRVEITDIERLARSALSDVRATTSGIREKSLAGELAVAKAVLTAAGITAVMPVAVDDVLPAGRELFGYVVKEAVTNVVRHSGASNCTVRLGSDWVEISDDGHGRDPDRLPTGDGHGLTGLQERMSAAGGVLTVQSLVPSGFSVRAGLIAATGSDR